MGSIPFAISIHKFVSSVGADAGFAAVIGLAILVLLYFAQARETATLREQATEAAERVGGLEARIAELARQAAAPVAAQAQEHPPVSPVPAGLTVPGATPSRLPILVGPPAGVAAPALAAATRLVPLATDNGHVQGGAAVQWPADPIRVQRAQPERADASPATVAAGNGGSHARVGPVAPAPRRRVEPGPVGAGAPRSNVPPRRPLLPPAPQRRRSPVLKAFVALLGLLVVAGAVAAVLILTSAKSHSPSSTSASRTTNAPAGKPGAVFNPARVTVAVLNGTGTTGLAHRTALRLASAGYKQGTVATATDQTLTATQVSYLPSYKTDALRVANSLKLSPASVQPISTATQAVACPPPAACTANVVVTVGSDLATVS